MTLGTKLELSCKGLWLSRVSELPLHALVVSRHGGLEYATVHSGNNGTNPNCQKLSNFRLTSVLFDVDFSNYFFRIFTEVHYNNTK